MGFVLRVEGQRLGPELEEVLPDFKVAFEGSGEATEGFYYYSDRTKELNARFGDMLHKIQDLEVNLERIISHRGLREGLICLCSHVLLCICRD